MDSFKISLQDDNEDQYYEFYYSDFEELFSDLEKSKNLLRKILFQNTKISIEKA